MATSGMMWSMSRSSDEHVSSDPGAWDHLGRLIRERRAELGLTQREIHSVGGPSPATLYQLESGHRGSYRPHILRRLERALGWDAGSVRRVLAGGMPLLDGDGKVSPPLHEEHTNGPDSREWIASFRKLPIDTHNKLLILSTLLQESIASLDPGLDGLFASQESRSARQGNLRDLPAIPSRSDNERGELHE
jgi:transcriptional regulator with XRE-family HTH domain